MTPGPIAAPGAVLLEAAARPLLIAHAVAGFAAAFSTTHHAVYSFLTARGQRRPGPLRRFGWIAPVALLSQVLLGLLLYPTYRVRVRAAHLDQEAPLVVQLFDFKEHLAALAVALVLGSALTGRLLAREGAAPGEGVKVAQASAALSITGAALVWAVALIGLYVTARHPVGIP